MKSIILQENSRAFFPTYPSVFLQSTPILLTRLSRSTYPSIDTNDGDLEEEVVEVCEDVPLDGWDVGEEGGEEEAGQAGEGHCQQGQQTGEHSSHLHLTLVTE